MTRPTPPFAHLETDSTSVVVALAPGGPEFAYIGAPLTGATDDDLAHLLDHPAPEGGFDELPPIAVVTDGTSGFAGQPGVRGHRPDGSGAHPQFRDAQYEIEPHAITATVRDVHAALTLDMVIALHPESSLLRIEASLTNDGHDRYQLDGLALGVPVPAEATEAMTLTGRWSSELQAKRHPLRSGTVTVENRSGRTSFDRSPFIAAGSGGFGEQHGNVWAAHLAWSGNAALRAEVLIDGRRILQAGELLLPGELVLDPGESYQAPPVLVAASNRGLNGISAAFHGYVRARASHPERPRPVGLNTWEAVYFDHRLEPLVELADRAAAVGVERFILDDGWFHGRRSDNAGLGDWWVDDTVWPDGLHPLVDHVTGLGMEFGLWFEPEMVNPDSELYRAHPDWALVTDENEQVMFRHQLILDLANPEVSDYLFGHIDDALSTYDISYIKWDCNRDATAPSHGGRASMRKQVLAVYALMDRVRAAHPAVEIESCASGGARIDLGVVDHTDRFWASDCNDALDRQQIQRGFSYLLPPELMGSHIGPPRAHTTERTHSLGFRAATALFGHLGIEWNLLTATERDLSQLAEVVAVHKRLRPLLHQGEVHRLDAPDPAILAHGVVAADRGHAVYNVTQVATSATLPTGYLRLAGLDPDARYRIESIPLGTEAPAQEALGHETLAHEAIGKAKRQPSWISAGGADLTGRQLLTAGIALPVLFPESSLLIEVVKL